MIEHIDLRDWLKKVGAIGELRTIYNADWNLEIGAVRDLIKHLENPPAIIFDEVKDYPKGYRVLVNAVGSFKRMGLTLGMPIDLSPMDFLKRWRVESKKIKNIPPLEVKNAPLFENVDEGKNINLFKFPTPKWFEKDGGRYIGTGSITITQDPDEGWVNLGLYRVMIHNENTLGFYISPGKQGRIHREKCYARGKPIKVAISFGHDPLLTLAGSVEIPWGVSEYEYVGGIRGEPIEVVRGPYTNLPIPASSEIVVEGESYPDELMKEGPYGEWTGYYASSARPEPVIRVNCVMHRNDPILLGIPLLNLFSGVPPYRNFLRSAIIWDALEDAGVPDVKGVWLHVSGGRSFIIIVSIKQRYPGHARQAGLVAAQCRAGAYMGRYVIVVDEDIDPSDNYEVLWAIASRTDPENSIEILRRCWSSPLDPPIPKDKKGFNSRAIIDATRPYEWIDEFPEVIKVTPEVRDRVKEKWGKLLLG